MPATVLVVEYEPRYLDRLRQAFAGRPLTAVFARDGAEVIVVTTNNRSYRRSANSAQHVALAQMRAAEIGRPVVQASISGISGRIDARGDVRHTTELFENEVVSSEVTTTTGQTPYVRYGDWVIWGSGIALVGATLSGRWRWAHPSASSHRARRRMAA